MVLFTIPTRAFLKPGVSVQTVDGRVAAAGGGSVGVAEGEGVGNGDPAAAVTSAGSVRRSGPSASPSSLRIGVRAGLGVNSTAGLTTGVAVGGSNVGTTNVGLQATNRTRGRTILARNTDFMACLLSPNQKTSEVSVEYADRWLPRYT
jgi:hypothetical protein